MDSSDRKSVGPEERKAFLAGLRRFLAEDADVAVILRGEVERVLRAQPALILELVKNEISALLLKQGDRYYSPQEHPLTEMVRKAVEEEKHRLMVVGLKAALIAVEAEVKRAG